MKKFFATLIALLMFAAQVEAVSLTSDNTTFAFQTITKTLHEWNCTPIKIWYSGIDLDDADNIAYMNQLADSRGFDHGFVACMVFYSDFISPPDPHDGKPTAWNYDSEYKNYSWYFGLHEDGNWYLMSNGY